MKWKSFSTEEIATLRSNPYTYKVTDRTIAFTVEFKEIFYTRLQEGITPSTIVSELGYDPEILGYSRIWGISQHVRAEADSGEGFHEGRGKQVKKATAVEISEMSNSRALIKMQNEINFLRQEMDFLKKIMQADRQNGRRK